MVSTRNYARLQERILADGIEYMGLPAMFPRNRTRNFYFLSYAMIHFMKRIMFIIPG